MYMNQYTWGDWIIFTVVDGGSGYGVHVILI